MNQSKIVYRSILAAAAILLATSCASTQEIDELRSMAEEAQRTAEQARSRAERAERRATDASGKADDALAKAEDALARAREAQTCCETNRKRMERMFEKSQQK